jgi:hypothetical protein
MHRQPTNIQEPKPSYAAVPTLAILCSVDRRTIRTACMYTAPAAVATLTFTIILYVYYI